MARPSFGGAKGGGASPEGGYVFINPQAAALVARFAVQPTYARKAVIDTTWTMLNASSGLVAKLIYLRLTGADQQASLLNWVQDLYNATAVASPTFVADRYFQGDGIASYLDTGFNPVVAADPKFVQDNAGFTFWSLNAPNDGSQIMGNGNTRANGIVGNTNVNGRPVNAGTTVAMATAAMPGCVTISRSGAAAWASYVAGVLNTSNTTASSAMANSVIAECAATTAGFGTNQMLGAAIHSDLSAQQAADLYAAMAYYKGQIGA